MKRHFMFFEVTLIAEFWFTLIAFYYLIPSCTDILYVFDSLMYWNFMCLEITLLTKFRITLIAWIFHSLMYRYFKFLRLPWLLNLDSHWLHAYLTPYYIDILCFMRWSCSLNFESHWLHENYLIMHRSF